MDDEWINEEMDGRITSKNSRHNNKRPGFCFRSAQFTLSCMFGRKLCPLCACLFMSKEQSAVIFTDQG